MFKVLIPSAVCLALIVAASVGIRAAVAAFQPRSTELSDMGWHLDMEDDTAKLIYGLAQSDHLALMLTCRPGQNTATLYGDVQPDTPHLQRIFHGPRPVDPLSNGTADEQVLSLQDRVLKDLARHGVMTVVSDTGRHRVTATATERRAIGDFLTYCGSALA